MRLTTELKRLLEAEARFAPWVERIPALKPLQPGRGEVYPALARAIVYQQLSTRAAATIHSRLLAYAGDPPSAPMIDRAEPSELRALGLSAAKTLALKDLVAHELRGAVPTRAQARRLSDAELTASLIQVRGIGPWTVQMMLLFTLKRPDIWPIHDLGVQTGLQHLLGAESRPDAQALSAFGEPLVGQRSVAARVLWAIANFVRVAP